jgi:poly(A) polymerase
VRIVQRLRQAGHQALLAGGCVRDLLRGQPPEDYDVATDATPRRVCALFQPTRKVGVQFGVVLVRSAGRWIEVATFRSDGAYLDGRHPAEVTFGDARQDAQRRDFTVNGMFLDPLGPTVIDYVGGQADLAARLVRCIGDPAARFEEDHLRLLRAVRFAARLGFEIESRTFEAMRTHAARLARVASERVREELERMLSHASRARAVELMAGTTLLEHLWPGASWSADALATACARLARLPAAAPFVLSLAVLLADRGKAEVGQICRVLTCSNEQREAIVWLVEHQADLEDPTAPSLAALKRLMAHPAFPLLHELATLRYAGHSDAAARGRALDERLAAIPADQVAPPPLVTGEDLLERGLPQGPAYKQILDELYTRQLERELTTRPAALHALDEVIRRGGWEDRNDQPRSVQQRDERAPA